MDDSRDATVRAQNVDDDRELLREIASGDLRRFDVFVDRYKHRLIRFLTLRTGDFHRAEDLCQEVFLRVFSAVGQRGYNGRSAVSTWLFTIASNCSTDALRAARRQRLKFAVDSLTSGSAEHAATQPLPIDRLIHEERRQEIASIFERLDDELRAAAALRLYGELTYAEISSVLNCPISTAKDRVRKALEIIRRRVGTTGALRDD